MTLDIPCSLPPQFIEVGRMWLVCCKKNRELPMGNCLSQKQVPQDCETETPGQNEAVVNTSWAGNKVVN